MTDEAAIITIDMDCECRECGKLGAMRGGLCMTCAAKQILGSIRMNESPVMCETIKTRLDHLSALYRAGELAKTEFAEAVKNVAEQAHCDASVLKKFVAAHCSDDPAKVHAKVQQLEFLFTELGE